jgi:hypothetical protein
MSKIILKNLILVIVIIFIITVPSVVFSARLSFELASNKTGDEQATIIEVKVDPQDKTLNVVEGIIAFEGADDKLSVETETGGSILTIWPTKPQYLSKEKAIRFTGGVPGGFDKKGLLFRIRLFSPVSGEIKINWVNGVAYLNDGNGTKEPIFSNAAVVNLAGYDLEVINKFSPDNQPPSFDTAEIGRDQNGTYDGKYFVSFNARDDVSGVDKYEVKEGQTITIVTDGVYILKDQTRATPVIITAYDKAGNSAVINVPAKINWQKYVIIILIIGALSFFLIFYVYKRTKK